MRGFATVLTRDPGAVGASRPVRALFVIAGLPAGGAERQLSILLSHLDRHVIEPGLLIFNSADRVHYREAVMAPLAFNALALEGSNPLRLIWPLISGVARTVREFAPDVVYAVLNVANHATRLSRLLFRWQAPVITGVRNDFRKGYAWRDKFAERLLWRQSAYIICNSPIAREQLIADVGVPTDRIGTIPNGIDPVFFLESKSPPPDWWPTGRVALVLGRFSPQKNHLRLLDALSRLASGGVLGQWRFVFVGEGPLESQIRTAVLEKNLGSSVTIHAPVHDPLPLYRAAQLVVLPSLYEGTPNTALEAQAAGRPVAIAQDANGAAVVVPESGFVLRGELSVALEPILRLPEANLVERGRAARTRMAREYGVERVVAQTQAILLRIASRRS